MMTAPSCGFAVSPWPTTLKVDAKRREAVRENTAGHKWVLRLDTKKSCVGRMVQPWDRQPAR